jgi:hypothetical protein
LRFHLSANGTHLAGARDRVSYNPLVGTRFVKGGFEKDLGQVLVGSTLAHGAHQIFLFGGQKAGFQVTVGRKTKSIAKVAKGMAQGADEADLPGGIFEFKTLGRAVLGPSRNLHQSSNLAQLVFDPGIGHMP